MKNESRLQQREHFYRLDQIKGGGSKKERLKWVVIRSFMKGENCEITTELKVHF